MGSPSSQIRAEKGIYRKQLGKRMPAIEGRGGSRNVTRIRNHISSWAFLSCDWRGCGSLVLYVKKGD